MSESRYYLARGPVNPDNEREYASLLVLPGWRLYDEKLDRHPEPIPLSTDLARELSHLLWSSSLYQPARSLAERDFYNLTGSGYWDEFSPEDWVRAFVQLVRFHLEDQKRQAYFLARCTRSPDELEFSAGEYYWILAITMLPSGEPAVACLDAYGTLCVHETECFEVDPSALARLPPLQERPRQILGEPADEHFRYIRDVYVSRNLPFPPPTNRVKMRDSQANCW